MQLEKKENNVYPKSDRTIFIEHKMHSYKTVRLYRASVWSCADCNVSATRDGQHQL